MLKEIETKKMERVQVGVEVDSLTNDETEMVVVGVVEALENGEKWEKIVEELKAIGIKLGKYDPGDYRGRNVI